MKARERRWTESVAVGDADFLNNVKDELGGRALGRKIVSSAGSHELRESQVPYNDHFRLIDRLICGPSFFLLRMQNPFASLHLVFILHDLLFPSFFWIGLWLPRGGSHELCDSMRTLWVPVCS